jgi:ribosomal-protein-alanine N-acetyltransferase
VLTLQTARLLLRDFVEADCAAIYALSQEPVVTRYQTWLRLTSEADACQWVQNGIYQNQLRPRQAYNLAVVHQQQVIGWIGWGFPSDPVLGDYDFGYALLPAAWGQGFMTEALRAACAFMFESLHAKRIFGQCASSNYASARVMEKVGMQLVHTWQEKDAVTGTPEEHRRYAIDIATWHCRNYT